MSDLENQLDLEEEFLAKDTKIDRKEKKALSKKDRSKFKKTDIDKNKKKQKAKQAKKSSDTVGRVLAVDANRYSVESQSKLYICSLRGALKKEKTKSKNLVAVGDIVEFEKLDDDAGVINRIKSRKSILSRSDNLRRNKEQLIAVNIDQVFITVSLFLPKLKPALIDRYIIAAKKGNMVPIVVLNKTDLLDAPPEMSKEHKNHEYEVYDLVKSTYENLGIDYIEVSAKTSENLDLLKKKMEGKTSVFSGQSGVGKTSLINSLLGTELDTNDVVHKTSKGAHTTSAAKLIPTSGGGFCIDTPGIKSFGIWDCCKAEIKSYFAEFDKYYANCQYANCTHIHEPNCGVKEAAEEGEISPLRYQSYLDLVESATD